jgi:hypothetical protein
MNMNAVSGIFVALALIFGGGYALDKIYVATKMAAVERIHRGMPHLSEFSNRLTCSKIGRIGALVSAPCRHNESGPRAKFTVRQ